MKPQAARQEKSFLVQGLVVPGALAILAFGAFWPALGVGITCLDDVNTIFYNAFIRSWSMAHVKAMWLSYGIGFGGVYQPLSWMTHAVDFSLWGDRFAGHHATSLAIHAGNAVLAYVLIRRLLELGDWGAEKTASAAAAAIGAVVWAVHPLRVQPVCWLATRSYLVPTFFGLLSLIAYLKAKAPAPRLGSWAGRGWLAGSYFSYSLSLFSKSIGLTLPLAMLAMDVWPLRRLNGKKDRWGSAASALGEKLPFFAAGLALFLVSLKGRAHTLTTIGPALLSIVSAPRLSQAIFEATFFLEKTVLPLRIISIYEVHGPLNPLDMFCGLRTLMLAALTTGLLAARRRWPAGWMCWLCYLITLAPVSGLIQYEGAFQIGEDKYSYLACIWLGAAAGFIALAALRDWRRWAALLSLGTILAALAGLTYRQAQLWADQDRWWQYNIAVNPECYLCRVALGLIRKQQGRLDEAVRLDIDAVRHWPYEASIESSVANTITESISAMGEPAKSRALARVENEFRERPEYPDLHYHLALWHDAQGRRDMALAQMRLAEKYAGQDAGLRFQIGLFYGHYGLWDAAIQQSLLAVKYDPKIWAAHYNLGYFLIQQGRFRSAQRELEAALKLDPDNPNALRNLAYVRSAQERGR